MAVVVPIDGDTAMDDATVGDLAVKADPTVDVLSNAYWSVHRSVVHRSVTLPLRTLASGWEMNAPLRTRALERDASLPLPSPLP
jgi:hypothetical protein